MYIKDIFYSIQGEGPYIGYPQIFVRFYGCNIHCDYCDEPDFVKDRKKMTVPQVLEALQPFLSKPVHSISITGGEPLIQVDALKALLPVLPKPVYLETNGTLPTHVAQLKELVTYFAVDYKPGFAKPFEAFLREISDRKHVFIKYILKADSPLEDVRLAAEISQAVLGYCPFILQPVTPFALVQEKVSAEKINLAFEAIADVGLDVRVIGQTHKGMGLK
ncbi:MAG: 7-carboxy-7-deazaguanine synthase QueE [Candidatus Margulisiibacteriota bacterium]